MSFRDKALREETTPLLHEVEHPDDAEQARQKKKTIPSKSRDLDGGRFLPLEGTDVAADSLRSSDAPLVRHRTISELRSIGVSDRAPCPEGPSLVEVRVGGGGAVPLC